ncbi:MAG TPA: photosynthetic reaction center cytochrome c subunit family protein, partial [Acetobacteraceae bacterium]|nr:photosynthetic reaction center cytochrome c subunit family protein [Acetobacteraceae bacterium]
MSLALRLTVGGVLLAATAVVLTQTERPPMDSIQRGYRGTGMEQIYNPRFLAQQVAANALPPTLPPAGDAGPKAGTIYKNVKVLNDVSVGEFVRLMASITTWVSPQQSCSYCHDVNNMASDERYPKVVARRMLE